MNRILLSSTEIKSLLLLLILPTLSKTALHTYTQKLTSHTMSDSMNLFMNHSCNYESLRFQDKYLIFYELMVLNKINHKLFYINYILIGKDGQV